MLSKTLHDGLKAYAIGDKIRALRLKKKMGLVELGRHSGLSPALLSKIERGRLFPTLPTLLRVALVFSVDLPYFLSGAREKPVLAIVRRKERLTFPERPGGQQSAYRFESLDYPAAERKLNAYYADFFPALPEKLRLHDHVGAEFIYTLRGLLIVQIAGEEHTLHAGDSLYFDSSQPHGYRRSGRSPCSAVIVTTL